MNKNYTIGGETYTLSHAGMGIYQIITPRKNSLRFANKDKALDHIAFLRSRHGK